MSPDTAHMITEANPLTEESAARLTIEAAEQEMLAAVLARPGGLPGSAASAPRRQTARLRRALPVLGMLAVAIPVIAVLAVLPTGRVRHRAAATAPPQTHPRPRAASSSPRVLLQLPGWHIWYADQQHPLLGELDYRRGAARTGAGLEWFPKSDTRGYIQDRGAEASLRTTTRLLGTTAHVFESKPARGQKPTFAAIWIMGARGLMYETGAQDLQAFEAQLGHLHVVDNATWLRALPSSVVTTAQRGAAIRQMLRGIPLPPGFRMSQIPGANLVRDRYQLGTAVTGVVACEWFARWGRARAAGDQTAVNRAISALRTAKHWPVLRQMAKQGAWPSVLLGYVKAMPSGRWYGRPLLGDVNSGLGCSTEWQIGLGASESQPGGPRPVGSGG